MHPLKVLQMVKSFGGELQRVLVVGCEPATFGPEEGQMGLSEPVENAVDRAITLIESLVEQIRAEGGEHEALPQAAGEAGACIHERAHPEMNAVCLIHHWSLVINKGATL